MLVRLVRLTLAPQHRDRFLALFDEAAPKIRTVDGCQHLELWEDARFPNVLTTYSLWRNAAALDAYRTSTLFQTTWAKTKPLFAAPPQAFSHTVLRNAEHRAPRRP
ncbi:MAG: antibiotic biosynthesis monooxygenase [Bacteroidetes bacterium]|jgi:quinol monooxygenase YgiN|nr:antibiotic biosynthesis monooxygenase [Bacteroidota bacterium]